MIKTGEKDYLTRFSSRDSFESFIKEIIRNAKENTRIFSMAMVDIDRFKFFNNKFGHLVGDDVIKHFANVLNSTLLKCNCIFFRYGGDEFILIFPDKETKLVRTLMQNCTINLTKHPFTYQEKEYKLTLSCGISSFPEHGQTKDELVTRADEAMFFSKRHGRNLVTLAGRLRYFKLRNTGIIITASCILFGLLVIVYNTAFIESTLKKMKLKNMQKTYATYNDMIILNSGASLRGKVVSETEKEVHFQLALPKGQGTVSLKKTSIRKIIKDIKETNRQ